MKFDLIIGNPPYQSQNCQRNIAQDIIRRIYKYLEKDGYMAKIIPTVMFGSGVSSIVNILYDNDNVIVSFNNDKYFNVVCEIGYFIVQNIKSNNTIIDYECYNGDKLQLDINKYKRIDKNLNYIPVGINKESFNILNKIIDYGNKYGVMYFRTNRRENNNKIDNYQIKFGIIAKMNQRLHYKNFIYSSDGLWDKSDETIYYYILNDEEHSIENIKSIIYGKIFIYFAHLITRKFRGVNNATIGYFPKMKFNKFWTFDGMANELCLNDNEKQIIIEWVNDKKIMSYLGYSKHEWQDVK